MRLVAGGALAGVAAIWACSDAYSGGVVAADAGVDGSPAAPQQDQAVVPGPVLDEAYTGGSRLQPNYLTVGTTKVFVDWWDTELAVHCTFRPLAGNEYRCVPRAQPAITSDSLFADASCRTPVVVLSTDASCASSGVVYADIGKGCAPRIVKLAGPSDGPYTSSSDGCSKKPSRNAFVRGADVPASAFVSATIEDGKEDLGAQLKAQYLTAADGARGFFRTVLKAYPSTPCAFASGPSDPALRCYPSLFATSDANDSHGNATCSAPLFPASTCTDGAVAALGRHDARSTDACDPARSPGDFYVLGATFTGKAWRKDGQACEPTNGDFSGLASTGKVDPQVFGTATRLEVAAAGALAVVYAVLPTGHRTTIGWTDAAHGGECIFGHGSDDRLHCFPTRAGLAHAFFPASDCKDGRTVVYSAAPALERCRTATSGFFGGPACPPACVLPPKPSHAIESTPECTLGPPTKQLFEVGAARPGFALITELLGASRCTALSRADEAVYEATLVAASTLPAATVDFP